MDNNITPDIGSSLAGRTRDWFLIAADTSIVAVHLIVVAAIIVWVIASGIHANLLGWIVISVPIMGMACALTFWVLRLALRVESDNDN